jgi:tyrosine-protein kinase Etk/Wzc
MLTPTHESGTPRPAADATAAPSTPTLGRAHPARRVRAGRDEPTLAELAWTLAERRWTVASVACAAVLGAAAYLFVAQPVYESSVLVQVEGRAKPAAPDAVVQLFDTNPPAEAEMRILRSRTILESVVDELGLDVEAQPRRFPVVGSGVARRRSGAAPAPAPLGLTRFAWGGERIQLKRLEVSDALVGEPLVLVAFEDGGYEVRTAEGAVLVTGEVGTEATGGDGDRTITLLVSELTARADTEFTLRKLRRVDVIDRLQKALVVTEQGRAAGLAEVRLTGSDPAVIAKILDALAATYVRQSLERTSAEAASMLRVLDRRLATLKSGAEAAELAMTRFHARNGSVNLSVDARRLLTRIAELDRAITEAELADSDLTRRHTARYPEAVAPAERAEQLRPQRTELEAQIAALPGLELEYARLSRQIGLTTERYTRLLDRVEELRAAKSGWLGNARVMERAVERRKPVSPKTGLVAASALLLGLVGGIAAALVRGAFDDGIRDPDEVESRTGLPVFATIPRSAAQRRMARRGSRRGRLEALSIVDPGDGAVEELRTLRTGVEFALRRATSNVVAVGSPAPRAGKSFVSVNLARLLAASGGRVLLVDCDLRRGVLHRYFGLEVQPGISDVLRSEASLDAAVRRTDDPSLDLLPAGARVTNPAELLSGAPFQRLLEEMRSRYAIVVVDTPPILSVTDSALVGRYAGVSLLVLRAGEQNTREVALAVKRLLRNGVSVRGAVLNDVRPTLGRYGRSGRYRRYETRSA